MTLYLIKVSSLISYSQHKDSSARSDVLIDLRLIGIDRLVKISTPLVDPIFDYCMAKLELIDKSDYVKAVKELIKQSHVFEERNNAIGSNSLSSRHHFFNPLKFS